MEWKPRKSFKMPTYKWGKEKYYIWTFPWGPLVVKIGDALEKWKYYREEGAFAANPGKYAERYFRQQADETHNEISYNTGWRASGNKMMRRHKAEIDNYIVTKLEIDGYKKTTELEAWEGDIWVVFEKIENGA